MKNQIIQFKKSKPDLRISEDGYIRIDLESFSTIQFYHLFSDILSPLVTTPEQESSYTKICGYTEWVSKTTPVLSLSWDWILVTDVPPPQYEVDGLPFSNIMLTALNQDLGIDSTNSYLLEKISKIHWKEITASHIGNSYR